MDTIGPARTAFPASARTLVIAGALGGITVLALAVALLARSATDTRVEAVAVAASAPPATAAAAVTSKAPAAPEREVCLSCGVVASVKPVVAAAARPGGVKGFFHALVHRDERRDAKPVAWDVRVRMDDGTTRTLRVAVAPKVGTKVDVVGPKLRPAPVMI